MARAVITSTETDIGPENMVLTFRFTFYRPPVQGYDSSVRSVTVTPEMTGAQIKTAIKQAIQQEATNLGYGTLERIPQHIDEVFHNL